MLTPSLRASQTNFIPAAVELRLPTIHCTFSLKQAGLVAAEEIVDYGDRFLPIDLLGLPSVVYPHWLS